MKKVILIIIAVLLSSVIFSQKKEAVEEPFVVTILKVTPEGRGRYELVLQKKDGSTILFKYAGRCPKVGSAKTVVTLKKTRRGIKAILND